MCVANGAGEGVGGIGRRLAREREQALHHVLDLLLARVTVAHHRLLHLQRGVFGDRKAGEHRGADRGAARLAERERGLRVDVDEDLLDRHLERAVRGDDFVQPFEDGLQALREVARAGLDAAAGDVAQLPAGAVDDAEAGCLQAGIDSEDSQLIIRSVEHRGGVHVLHVVEVLERIEQ